MSAQPELFETVSAAGRRFVTQVRRTGGEVDRAALSEHLRSSALAYVAQGGASEITEAMVSELVSRVTAWCADVYQPRSMRGRNSPSNDALFHHLRALAYEWSKGRLAARRGRGAVDRDALRAFLEGELTAFRSVPGQAHDDDGHEAVVGRIVGYSGQMSRKAGREIKAARRAETERRGATVTARDEAYFAVRAVIDQDAWWAEKDGREPRQFSMADLHEAVRYQTVSGPGGVSVQRETGITLAAVRGAVERHQGQPRRQRRIDALPHTARDLAHVLDIETPEKAITVLTTDSVASRLWAQAGNPAARRQQRRRLRLAADAINGCHVSLHVEVVGEHVVVARGLRMPADVAGTIETAFAAKSVHHLQGGLMVRRQGVLGTEVGRDCVAMVRAATSEYGSDDLALLLNGYGLPEAATTVRNAEFNMADWFLDGIEVVAGELRARAAEDDPEFDQNAAGAHRLTENERTCRDRARGPFQAWHTLTRCPAYRARVAGAENSAARHRIRQVYDLLGQVDHLSDIEALFAAAVTVRPGRKRKPVVAAPPRPLDVQRPLKEAKPVYQPQPETFQPTYVEPSRLSMDTLEALEIHHRLNVIQPAARTVLALFLDITVDAVVEAHSQFQQLPWPKEPEAAKAGLRRVLRAWEGDAFAAIRLLDVDGKGTAKAALLAAGCALRDDPSPLGVAYACDVVGAIFAGCQGIEQGRNLRPSLMLATERHDWLRARANLSSKARAA